MAVYEEILGKEHEVGHLRVRFVLEAQDFPSAQSSVVVKCDPGRVRTLVDLTRKAQDWKGTALSSYQVSVESTESGHRHLLLACVKHTPQAIEVIDEVPDDGVGGLYQRGLVHAALLGAKQVRLEPFSAIDGPVGDAWHLWVITSALSDAGAIPSSIELVWVHLPRNFAPTAEDEFDRRWLAETFESLKRTPRFPPLLELAKSRTAAMGLHLQRASAMEGEARSSVLRAGVCHGMEEIFGTPIPGGSRGKGGSGDAATSHLDPRSHLAPYLDLAFQEADVDALTWAFRPLSRCFPARDCTDWDLDRLVGPEKWARIFTPDDVDREINCRTLHRLAAHPLFSRIEATDGMPPKVVDGGAFAFTGELALLPADGPAPKEATAARGASPASSAPTPARQLARFILQHCDSAELERKLRLLRDQGYEGYDDKVLIEWVHRLGQPAAALDLFSEGALAAAAAKKGAPHEEVANRSLACRWLLEHFGYPLMDEPRGIRWYQDHLENLRRRSLDGSADSAVIEAARILERLSKHLLHFYAFSCFQLSPNELAWREGWLKQGEETVDEGPRRSLGTLFGLLSKLDDLLAQSPEKGAKAFRRRHGEARLLQLDSRFVAECRNFMTHDREGPSPQEYEYAKLARGFFAEAVGWGQKLGMTPEPLYPQVALITEAVEEAAGVTYRATVAGPRETRKQRLYYRDKLQVGSYYFMRPYNNPDPVDPLMILITEVVQPRRRR